MIKKYGTYRFFDREMHQEHIDQTLEKTMREKTKVILYTLLLLLILIASFVYSNYEKESCESIGGVYGRQPMSWSYECVTNLPDTAKELPEDQK